MRLLRLLAPAALLGGHVLLAADGTELVRALPAETPFVLHVRNLPNLLANWEYTPFAKTWNEPDVQRFFAPARDSFFAEMETDSLSEFEANTGMKPLDVVRLFTGEVVLAMLEMPPIGNDTDADPVMVFGARLGENRARLQEMLALHAGKSGPEETEVQEEFQGETLHVTMELDEESGERREAQAWVVIDDVFWMAEPKATLQQIVANFKRGGAAESLAGSAAFTSMYQDNSGADFGFYFNLEPVVALAMAGIEASEAAAIAAGMPPQSLFGMSTADLMRALGVDAMRVIYGTAAFGRDATVGTVGLTWSERRGIFNLLTYGDPPAPQPAFASDAWQTVSSSRFSIQQFYEGLKRIAGDANPMIEALVQQQIAGINQALGIDLERDFFGSFGDEFFTASGEIPLDEVAAGLAPREPQLWAVSLKDSATFRNAVGALMALVPPQFAAMIEPREYLGETINTFAMPAPDGGMMPAVAPPTVSYAITQGHLFVGINGGEMIETALQLLQGTGRPIWSKPEVMQAIAELPPGGSTIEYIDLRKVMSGVFGLFAASAGSGAPFLGGDEDEDGDEAGGFVDPAAVPPPGVVEKHWSTGVSSVYQRADGLHALIRIKHVD